MQTGSIIATGKCAALREVERACARPTLVAARRASAMPQRADHIGIWPRTVFGSLAACIER
jgi:4'-phosphopantetheinyl transferase EntD